MNFIYISHHFKMKLILYNIQYEFHMYFISFHCKGRYGLSKLTWFAMCGFTAFIFRLLPSNCLNWKIYCEDRTLHFHLQPQYNMNFIYISLRKYSTRELFLFEENGTPQKCCLFVGLFFFFFSMFRGNC